MKKRLLTMVIIALTAFAVTGCVYDKGEIEMINPHSQIVTEFLNKLVQNDFGAANAMLSPELAAALTMPFEMIAIGRYGDLLEFTVLDSMEADGMYIAVFQAVHAKGTGVFQLILDANGGVLGIAPVSFAFEPMMPPAGAQHTAEPVVIGEGSMWALDGLLTMPNTASADNPVPALILIPGSGANNMDSSIFENRPFFDIANYLSDNGVAVLRFNERAFTHGAQLGQVFGMNLTVHEEYIEDALLAVEILRADPRISQVYLLGLSQGGLMAPRIAAEAGLDGVIVMAGTPHPFHVIWYNQTLAMTRDALAAGEITQAQADESLAAIAAQMEEARRILSLPAHEIENVIIMGAFPVVYEQSIIASLPLPFIANNPQIPVLILQGGRDFQTTVEDDFQFFVDGTAGMAHVTTRLYDTLNHLMMTAYRQEGPLVVDVLEYRIPGTVDAQVLRGIVEWIEKN